MKIGRNGWRRSGVTANDVVMRKVNRRRCRRRGYKNMRSGSKVREAWTGEGAKVTLDRVPRAGGKVMKNKANGLEDWCSVSEKLRELLMETVYENYTLVWEEAPGGVQGARSMEDSPFGVSEETRCEAGEKNSGVSGHRADVGVGEVVCGGGGGPVTGRGGTSGMELRLHV